MHRKKPCGAGLRPSRTISLEEHRVGGTEISGLKLNPSTLALSAALLENHALLEHLELLAFNTWAEFRTLNQHLVKSLKKPLKV